MKKIVLGMMTVAIAFFGLCLPVYGAEPVIVVIDPGHGGENLGAEYEKYTEKDMTMITAVAMKEELEKYEGITVYLTREKDKDMTLKERVEFAASVNADFLFCLHYNMSVNHNLFGAEVWVSAFGEQYRKGYTFADIEINMLKELGLYSRGIKTKLNDRGEDYYGIIRHATARDLTAALIEHCHLDQENDKAFYTSEEKLKQFGILDATAVAKYYGLKSDILGVDYGSYQRIEIPTPSSPVKPDKTEPDVCLIEVTDVNEKTGDISVKLSAEDYDSYMLYYSYSYDGGASFSELQRWEGNSDTIRFTVKVPSGAVPEIVVNAYNGFDGFTESNHVSLPLLVYGEAAVEAGSIIKAAEETRDEEERKALPAEPDTDIQPVHEEKQPLAENSIRYFLQVSILCAAILIVLLLLAGILISGHSKKKRRRRK